ncbi:unnamed protein product [Orchesella dallaii]|uniref:DIRP domain-containing protein n=1 Tax=Orchesella dallaii TaxID=48710 RepID=A0ABP1Q8Q7_9HEXA
MEARSVKNCTNDQEANGEDLDSSSSTTLALVTPSGAESDLENEEVNVELVSNIREKRMKIIGMRRNSARVTSKSDTNTFSPCARLALVSAVEFSSLTRKTETLANIKKTPVDVEEPLINDHQLNCRDRISDLKSSDEPPKVESESRLKPQTRRKQDPGSKKLLVPVDRKHSPVYGNVMVNNFRDPLTSSSTMKLEDDQRTQCNETYTKNALRMKHLLGLPKAFRWVRYEWFYSPIDRVIFQESNEFEACLKEGFPNLKARKLRRVEWVKIRRMIGKPRRLSSSLLEMERNDLADRREQIRQIQKRNILKAVKIRQSTFDCCPTGFGLPDEVPMQLMIGTEVTAILRKSPEGLFTGKVSGIDLSDNTYRISFNRPILGCKSIPDVEVMPDNPPDTLNVSSVSIKLSRQFADKGSFLGLSASRFPIDGTIGGFPAQLLYLIFRLRKRLTAKGDQVEKLKELNVEAEKLFAYNQNYPKEFVLRYALCVSLLDKLNEELSLYFDAIHHHFDTILDVKDPRNMSMVLSKQVFEKSNEEAEILLSCLSSQRGELRNKRIPHLITLLTSLMLQLKTLSVDDGKRNVVETKKSIKTTTECINASLMRANVNYFENKIEIPVNRISAGLCCMKHSDNVATEQHQMKRKTCS